MLPNSAAQRAAQLSEAGIQANVRPDLVALAVQRCIEATFDEGAWRELGYLTGTRDRIESHSRLLRSLRWGDDDYGACIFHVLDDVLGHEFENLPAVVQHIGLEAWLRASDPRAAAQLFGGQAVAPTPTDLSALTNPAVILQHLDRLSHSLPGDPDLAMGTAKELIESTAKLVLDELGQPIPNNGDFPELMKAATKALELDHSSITPDGRGDVAVKRVLGGLNSIAGGVNELRNLYGTGHGHITTTGLAGRHLAQLACDAAGTWCRAVLAVLADRSAAP